jgi:hypothetical protein
MAKHAVPPDQLTLHADRGGPMKAKATALMLALSQTIGWLSALRILQPCQKVARDSWQGVS